MSFRESCGKQSRNQSVQINQEELNDGDEYENPLLSSTINPSLEFH